ncbi:MAG: ABC transporter ATP-binding protein [Nitrososphaerales archaeon]
MVLEIIKVESVSKSFGAVKAVRDLNLVVKAGEISGLLGPNGSGKSTTMKIIMGILKPDSGMVNVSGVDVKERPVYARRMIGYVPETPYLYEYLTAAEYLDFVGVAYGIEPEVRKQRVEELLQALQMDGHVNEIMSGFSQGMKQKIALTAALLHKPKVLILDEPLNGLDPRSARIVKELLHRLAKEDVAILFSTHVLEIVEAICRRVTIMNEGLVLAEGSVQELRSMAGLNGSSLEDVFLKLTGGEDTAKIVEALKL